MLSTPAWAGTGQASGLVRLSIWRPKSGRPASCQVPWSEVPPSWLCRWAKLLVVITVWVLQVGTQSANIQRLVAVSSSSFSVTIKFQGVKPCIFPCSPCGVRQEWGLPGCYPQHWGQLMSTLGSLFPLKGLREDLLVWCCASWGGGRCSAVSMCPSFPLYCSLSGSLVWCWGLLQSQPHVLGFAQWCLLPDQLLVLTERAKLEMTCVTLTHTFLFKTTCVTILVTHIFLFKHCLFYFF